MLFSSLQESCQTEKRKILESQLSQSARFNISQAHLSLFDSMELQNHEKTIVPTSSSNDLKKKWLMSRGSQDFNSQRSEDYQSLERRVRYRLDKMESQGESVSFTTITPFTNLGDKMSWESQSYLTAQIQMTVQGNQPKFTIRGVRK
jgi:hypothetical protein